MVRAAEAKRAAIVEAAAEQFHHGGIQGTALADVARAAAVAPGNMFTYFRTKDALSEAVAERWTNRVTEIVGGLDAATPDPLARIRLFLDRSRDHAPAYAERGCPLAMLSRDFRQLSLAAGPAAEPFRVLAGWLTDQLQAAADPRAERHARFLLATLQGAFVLAHAEGDTGQVEEMVEELQHWLGALGLGKAVPTA